MKNRLLQKSLVSVILLTLLLSCKTELVPVPPIRPSSNFPGYWEYKGNTVLLLGGTRNDNLYQEEDASEHLREMAAIGGNYIRNTMSARDSTDIQPFLKLADGRYDLNQWNDEYWERLENMLVTASKLDIIIQIEVWDRFDFSRAEWLTNAFHPINNTNYTVETSGLEARYPDHPGNDLQPFFHSIPGMPLYNSSLDLVRAFQEKYVDKLLSYTLKYPNILYTINNETNTPVEWGQYWINFIKQQANTQLVEVYVTDMFEDFYRVDKCEPCIMSINTPDIYEFIDASQINSRHFGDDHWEMIMEVMTLVESHKRPVNTTKVYGGGETSWGSGTLQDGVERFCRDVVGGIAAVRFHRPPTGNGLNDLARAAIFAVRSIEKYMKLWEIKPAMEHLTNREENEAFLSTNHQDKALVYFPAGGSVDVNIPGMTGYLSLNWIGVAPGNKLQNDQLMSQGTISLTTPDDTGWFAVITKGR